MTTTLVRSVAATNSRFLFVDGFVADFSTSYRIPRHSRFIRQFVGNAFGGRVKILGESAAKTLIKTYFAASRELNLVYFVSGIYPRTLTIWETLNLFG